MTHCVFALIPLKDVFGSARLASHRDALQSPASRALKRSLGFLSFWLAAVVVFLGMSTVTQADVRLPNVIGSNMVLQRDRELILWGWAEPDEEVTVKLGSSVAKSAANGKGEWKVKLPAQVAGGPHTVTVSGRNTIELTNVLVGEVWLGSGQSNMEMSVFRTSSRVKDDVASAKYPQIRLFNVAPKKRPTFCRRKTSIHLSCGLSVRQRPSAIFRQWPTTLGNIFTKN